jgi:hypothetical protein
MTEKKRRDLKPAPMPPAAGGAAGHWMSGPGRDWRPIPSVKPASKDGKRQRREPEGEVFLIDDYGQQWREGQRLF